LSERKSWLSFAGCRLSVQAVRSAFADANRSSNPAKGLPTEAS
jgi:hypothetical protein